MNDDRFRLGGAAADARSLAASATGCPPTQGELDRAVHHHAGVSSNVLAPKATAGKLLQVV